jgi:hypothetical protein
MSEEDSNEQPSAIDHPSIRLGLVSKLRRDLIAHLAADGTDRELDELAKTLLVDRRDEDYMLSGYQIQLHHVHLPALEQAGLISYDSEQKHIVKIDAEELADVAAYLESNADGKDDIDV